MFDILGSVLGGIFNIGDKLIEDKDKKNEFAFKALELTNVLAVKLLDTPTYKWVDALVKLSYASEQLVKGLLRPIGSLALAGYAAYCDTHGIQLSETVQVLLYGAPVGWGVSRHAEKRNSK